MTTAADLAFGTRRYGFNFQWVGGWEPGSPPKPADERALDFLQKHGFNLIRIPTDYRFWTKDFDYLHPDEGVFEHVDRYLETARCHGLHLSLNFHRAPGYCINRNDLERDNLWTDEVALEGFVHQWSVLARRYKGISSEHLSFDLVNEPPKFGAHGFSRDANERVVRQTTAAIRAIDPGRAIVIDGLEEGHTAMPELADLGVVHSTRGYQPMTISHYQASWWPPGMTFPEPQYPGTVWFDKSWDRETIDEFYRPWREVEAKGNHVYIGEFGCYNRTPNDVALRWLGDLFALLKLYRWGYCLWNFAGSFGIIDHGRAGARIEELDGYLVDRDLLDLMKQSRA